MVMVVSCAVGDGVADTSDVVPWGDAAVALDRRLAAGLAEAGFVGAGAGVVTPAADGAGVPDSVVAAGAVGAGAVAGVVAGAVAAWGAAAAASSSASATPGTTRWVVILILPPAAGSGT